MCDDQDIEPEVHETGVAEVGIDEGLVPVLDECVEVIPIRPIEVRSRMCSVSRATWTAEDPVSPSLRRNSLVSADLRSLLRPIVVLLLRVATVPRRLHPRTGSGPG